MNEAGNGTAGPEKSPEDEFRDWVALERNIAHIAMAKRLLNAITVTGPSTEAFVGWMLGGIGAAVVLLISNLDKLSPALSSEGLVTSICWLTLAAVFGVFAKANYQSASINKAVGDAASEGLLSSLAAYDRERRPHLDAEAKRLGLVEPDGPDMNEAVRMALSGQPWLARWAANRGTRMAAGAQHVELVVDGRAARWTFFQRLNCLMMICVAIVAVLNTLCFLARPPFFTSVLYRLF